MTLWMWVHVGDRWMTGDLRSEEDHLKGYGHSDAAAGHGVFVMAKHGDDEGDDDC